MFGDGFRAYFKHRAPVCTGRLWKTALNALLVMFTCIQSLTSWTQGEGKCLESTDRDKQTVLLYSAIKMPTRDSNREDITATLEIQWILWLSWATVSGWYHFQLEKMGKWEITTQNRFPSSATLSSETERTKASYILHIIIAAWAV